MDDRKLPKDWHLGITNIISRPTRSSSELSFEEMVKGAEECEVKIRKWQPKSVCVVGKGIWDAIFCFKTGKKISYKSKVFEFGWQEMRFGETENFGGALVFVVPSTSGRVAAYTADFKQGLWNIYGKWIQSNRDIS